MDYRYFETWTREGAEAGALLGDPRPPWRPGRWTLALVGVALMVLSAGLVFADVRSVGNAEVGPPGSERLSLTIPRMERVRDIPVYNGAPNEERKLAAGALHIQDTDFPWEKEANVYIAGHRLGYPKTKSFLVFWNLDKLGSGDRVVLKDAKGRKYVYRVFAKRIIPPDELSVMNPMEGENIVTLQTCTLPDYEKRLIVQAKLVS